MSTAAGCDRTVMLARVRAQASECLRACEEARGHAVNENKAAITATIEPLRQAVVLLAQAVSASVGYVVASKREAAEPALTGGQKAQGA